MKKRIIICLILVLVVVAAFFSAKKIEFNYYYNHPVYDVSYFVMDSEKSFRVQATFSNANSEKSNYTVDPSFEKEWTELAHAMKRNGEIVLNYTIPMYLEQKIEIKDGKTIISYSGKATNKDGEVVDVYEEEVLDYEIRANFPDEQNFESKYWNPDLTRK